MDLSPEEHVRQLKFRNWLARVTILLVIIAGLVILARFGNRLEREIKAGCGSDLEMAKLPGLTPTPNPVLVRISTTFRHQYVEKGCEDVTDPDTGQPFGPPPPLYTPVPATPPPR